MDEHELVDQLYAQYSKLPSMRKSNAVIYDHIMGFYHAVSWSQDLWLFGIFGFHVAYLLLVVFARKFYYLQVFLFAYGCLAILSLERANEYLANNWRLVASQNYFDKHGVFLSVIVAAPVLLVLSVQLLLTLKDAARLVVDVKRLELKRAKKE
ncbi:hypothetical protein BASA81_007540 [Batrachochytrium salamandrivorans]|nr:hypothetical protein BASA81_007540 [Batrachochytrium salamandrivorans]